MTLINDIVVVDTSGKILKYACQVASDKPLEHSASALRKHISNELTRMLYSGITGFCMEELSECIKRRLRLSCKLEVTDLVAR